MAYEFKFPDVGEGIAEGEIVKWHVKVGDIVKEHDILAEIETDKAVAEIPAPVAGKILKINFSEGQIVKVGEVMVVIGSESEMLKQKEKEREKDSGTVMGQLPEAEEELSIEKKAVEKASRPKTLFTETEPHVIASPSTRKLARDLSVDINYVTCTGPGGRVTDDDVKRASSSTIDEAASETKTEATTEIQAVKKYDFFGYIEHVSFRGVRKTTARNMVKSIYTATHVTHMDEADVTELYLIREKEKVELRKKGIHLTFMPFILKALVKALKEYPYLNATLDEEKQEIILKKYYSIGVAVDIEGGLLVPVVKNVQLKTIADIAKEIQDLAEKARSRTIDVMDMKGGTFTVTNVGSIGGIFATPIINYPEVAILAMGKIMDKPVVVKGKIEIRKVMPLSLAFDHRVLDGAEAARFTTRLIELLQDPEGLMIE